DLALERGVGDAVETRDVGVELGNRLADLREFTLDLACEQVDVGRDLEPRIVADVREHRIERNREAPELLRLRELLNDAPEYGRRRRQQIEGATRQHGSLHTVARSKLPLSEDQHAEFAARQEGRRQEGTERTPQDDDVVVSRGTHRASPPGSTTTKSRAPGRLIVRTRPSASHCKARGKRTCSCSRMRRRRSSCESSGCTGTVACAMMGPESTPASTKCTVQPAIFTP